MATGLVELLLASLSTKAEVEEKPKRVTKAERVAAWQKDLSQLLDEGKLEELESLLQSYASEIMMNWVQMSSPRELTQEEVDQLGEEWKANVEIQSMLDARKADIRRMVFTSLDEEFAEDEGSERPPQQRAGELKAKNGVRFKREGGGRKSPSLDEGALQEILGDDVESVFNKVVIPEQVQYVLDEEKFEQAIESGKITIEQLRSVVKEGGWSTPRFQVR